MARTARQVETVEDLEMRTRSGALPTNHPVFIVFTPMYRR